MITKYAGLRAEGVNIEAGLEYCGNEDDFYRTLLSEYVKGAEEKRKELEELFEKQDWKRYAIIVHALKGTSRMIGAISLSETAKTLQDAADLGEEEILNSRHGELLGSYASLVGAIRKELGPEGQGETEQAGEKDGIFEFFPEG